MNKAILIVICDFLVSAMLTMMTGMVPGRTVKSGSGIDEKTAKMLMADYVNAQAQLELMRQRLFGKGDAEKTSHLSADIQAEVAELRKQLVQEAGYRKVLEEELAASKEDKKSLEAEQNKLRQNLSETKDKLIASQEKNLEDQKKLAEKDAALADSGKKLAVSETTLKNTREELSDTRKKLSGRENDYSQAVRDLAAKDTEFRMTKSDLSVALGNLAAAQSDNKALNIKIGDLKRDIGKFQEKARSSSESNADLKDRLERAERERTIARLEERAAKTEVKLREEALAQAVRDKAELQQQRDEAKGELAKTAGELKAAKEAAETASKNVVAPPPTEYKVFENYCNALVKIQSTVSQERDIIADLVSESEVFFPVVDFGNGRLMVIGVLNRFAGDYDKVIRFSDGKINNLLITMHPVFGDAGKSAKVLDRMRVAIPPMSYIAAFEFPNGDLNIKPLKMLSAAEVQKFGIDDLVLFKCSGYESNETLKGRVSLSMDQDSPSLMLRDGGRGNLIPESGDLIMTRRGELVGIVPHKSERLADGNYGVRIPLIKDVENFWKEAIVIPLNKNSKEKYYSGFAKSMQQLRQSGGVDREGKVIPVKK